MGSESETDPASRPAGEPPASDPDRYFNTEHLTADLKGRSVRGGAVTMAAQGVRFLLNLTSIMVLARLLAPEDFGLVAMVLAVSGFVSLFKDMGLSMATVQRSEITHAQVSTLFWFNVAVGLVLGVLLVCLATPIAWFFGEPRLVAITSVLALGIPVGGLSIQHQALLRRQMRFVALAVVDTVAMLAGIVTAITLAALGTVYWPDAKYWALVAMPLATAAVTTMGMWAVCRWRPSSPRRGSGVRPLLSFGGYLTGFRFVNYFARNLDNILIGFAWGKAPLGFYSRAYSLLMLPLQQINTPVTAIAIPVLSRLVDSPERYRAYYRQGVLMVASIGMPIVAFSFVAAEELVLLFLGSQWIEAASIFRALSPAAFIGTFNVATGWVFLSQGTPNRQFRASLVLSTLTAIAFATGLHWGPVGVAAAYSVVQCVNRLPYVMYCFRGTPVRLADLGWALWRPAFSSITAGLVTMGLAETVLQDGWLVIRLAVGFLVFCVSYVLVSLALPNGRATASEMWRHVGDARLKATSLSSSQSD